MRCDKIISGKVILDEPWRISLMWCDAMQCDATKIWEYQIFVEWCRSVLHQGRMIGHIWNIHITFLSTPAIWWPTVAYFKIFCLYYYDWRMTRIKMLNLNTYGTVTKGIFVFIEYKNEYKTTYTASLLLH